MLELTRADKLLQAGIKRYGSIEGYRAALAERGRKGGVKTGDSKIRGSREYYQRIGSEGGKKRHAKNTKM